LPIAEAPLLRFADYIPDGGTALDDAIGRTIQAIGRKVTRLTPVIVIIITDGDDTCSHRFTSADIRQMITYRSRFYNWSFIFLGPKSGLKYAELIGIPADHVFSFEADAAGVAQILDKLGGSLEAYRAGEKSYILRLQAGNDNS
jgi:hypothetical protein